MKNLLHLFFFFSISISTYGQMNINDPQSWWGEAPASIENIAIEVKTLGAYVETAIAFDIKLVDQNYFYGVDLLEFTFDFKLNDGAIMNDSWLWIDDYISVGEVYEQGEGTQIYESIVDRQQDPSILTQLSSTDYNLKVYPMKWDSTRRVRLSYLEPLDYRGKQAIANLPLGLLKHSESSPDNITITVYDDERFTTAGLNSNDWMLEQEGIDFKVYKNNYVIYHDDIQDVPVSYTFNDHESDYFLNTYDSGEESFYQLVYYPDINPSSSQENRMVIFDFDSFTSETSFEEMKAKLRMSLLEMGEEDNFIICTSDFITRFSSEDWMPATADNIETALNEINLPSTIMESQLSTLLPQALYKVEELSIAAEIVLLSPNNEYNEEQKAQSFLHNIIEFYNSMQTEVSVSIVDYARSKPGSNIDGATYYGNDYIYENITAETNGEYYSELSGDDVYGSLLGLFSTASSYTDQYDFHLSVEDGFVYSDFDNLKNEIEVGGERPIVSTGKYFGEGMFDVQFSAKIGNDFYVDSKKLDPNQGANLDNRAESIWYGELIKSIQHSGDFEDRREVIQTSIEERLLSLHTVFLCLEPDLESISANNNNDDGGDIIIATTDDKPEPELKLNIYPNPFIEKLTIEFPVNNVSTGDEVIINILDSKGQLIEKITKTNNLVNGLNTFEWTPSQDLALGMYIVQVLVNENMYNQKVLHVK